MEVMPDIVRHGTDARTALIGRRRSKERLRFQLYCALFALDAAALMLGFLAIDAVRGFSLASASGTRTLALLLPIYLIVAINNRAYTLNALTRPGLGIRRALKALAIALAAVLFVTFSLKTSETFSRLATGAGAVLAGLAILLFRKLFHRLAPRLYGASPLSVLLILDGAEPPPGIGRHDHVIHAGTIGLEPDVNDPMMMDRLGRLLEQVDRVVISCAQERRARWAVALKGTSVRGEILTPELTTMGVIGTGQECGQATLQVSTESIGVQARALKRAMDLVLVSIALLALSPLMLAVAIAIRLEDGGPALFVQPRLGRGNRLFNMYKFRSMRVDGCDERGHRSTDRDDDRVTRIGRFIRRTSLDELPQLFNIFRGEMSIVGPRPHALGSLAGDSLFWEVDLRYWHRHASKPGLTGLAQVRGFRGATHCRQDLLDRLQADLEYQQNWTILRDMAIILATFRVLIHRNAF